MNSRSLRKMLSFALLPVCACLAVAMAMPAAGQELVMPDDKLLADYYFDVLELPPGMELEKPAWTPT